MEIICCYCGQAAGKLLKSVSVAHGQEPQKDHDLVHLCMPCVELDPRSEALVDACAELSPYGVQARDPSGMELEGQDMARALAECRRIAALVPVTLDVPSEGGLDWPVGPAGP